MTQLHEKLVNLKEKVLMIVPAIIRQYKKSIAEHDRHLKGGIFFFQTYKQ